MSFFLSLLVSIVLDSNYMNNYIVSRRSMGKFIYPRISTSPRIFIPRIPIEKYLADKNNLDKLTNGSTPKSVNRPAGRRLHLIRDSQFKVVRNPTSDNVTFGCPLSISCFKPPLCKHLLRNLLTLPIQTY